MISPVVTHPVWALDLERRIRQARADAVARSVGRARGRRGLVERRPAVEPWAGDLRDPGDDIWAALRL